MSMEPHEEQDRKAFETNQEDAFGKLVGKTRDGVTEAHDAVEEAILQDAPPDDCDISGEIVTSKDLLGKYVTLDPDHFIGIMRAIRDIKRYCNAKTLNRPLNILLQAPPGSGKSHFVKCLAGTVDKMKVTNCNMTGVETTGDLAVSLEDVRNSKSDDRLPLLFLDEFDAHELYGELLPLLWDGELMVKSHVLKVGKIVIVLAGSKPKLEEIVALGQNTSAKAPYEGKKMPAKLEDLLSRINGPSIRIPPLQERPVDKVCIAVSLLLGRFPKLLKVPWALLYFVGKAEFRYGVRSIFNIISLVDEIDDSGRELLIDSVKLPLANADDFGNSSLANHLYHKHGNEALVKLWKGAIEKNVTVEIAPEPEMDDFELAIEAYKSS